MTPEEVLKGIIEKLEKYEIEYRITGSFASNLHGVPGTTFDADIVVSSDKLVLGEKIPIEKPNLPFQTVEKINKPRLEKLGRRWLGCDLSKFAMQVTRKRLLDIHNSKDLTEDER